MKRTSSSRRPTKSPKRQPKSNKRSLKQRFLARLRKVILYSGRAVGMLVIGTLFIVFTTGIRPPLPFGSSPKAEPQVQPAPVKPQLVGAPEGGSCAAQRKPDTVFASCASLWVDYRQSDQKTVGDIFNIRLHEATATHNQAQLYTKSPKNIRVENNNLMIVALEDPQEGYGYTSARIDTLGKKDFLYGKLVVRAKLPTTAGTWPAIWMLPSESRYAKLSPANNPEKHAYDGEIDFAEAMGSQPHLIYGVAHSLAYRDKGVSRTFFDTVKVPRNDVEYHDYGVEWTPTQITMTVDDKPFFTYKKQSGADYTSWPFDQPFYLVINLALGGESVSRRDLARFPTDGIDSRSLPAAMQIQSIRYYSYIGR